MSNNLTMNQAKALSNDGKHRPAEVYSNSHNETVGVRAIVLASCTGVPVVKARNLVI